MAAQGDPAAAQRATQFFQEGSNQAILRGVVKGPEGVSAKEQAETEKIRLQSQEIQQKLNAGEKPKKEEIQKQVNVLRKDIATAGKSFELVRAANNRIKRTGNKGTPASDISLVFNFMKMNDPGSTVREGEFATAQNAEGVPGRIVNMYNQLLEGTRLNPDQRLDFMSQSEGLFTAQRDAFDTQIDNTLQQADQDQIPRVRVLGKSRLKEFMNRRKNPKPIGGGDVADVPPALDLSQLSLDELIKLRQKAQ
jgi:hypothetical protein